MGVLVLSDWSWEGRERRKERHLGQGTAFMAIAPALGKQQKEREDQKQAMGWGQDQLYKDVNAMKSPMEYLVDKRNVATL